MRSLLPLLVLLSSSGLAQKPSQGKVLLYVAAGEAAVYKDLQQKRSELEESAKDIRRHLGKGKWAKVTTDVEEADIRIAVLGRRRDPDRGIALGYSLDAGTYETEDEVFDQSVSADVMGGASKDVRSATDDTARKSTASYEDLAKQFARSLDAFCHANYERIIRQRKN